MATIAAGYRSTETTSPGTGSHRPLQRRSSTPGRCRPMLGNSDHFNSDHFKLNRTGAGGMGTSSLTVYGPSRTAGSHSPLQLGPPDFHSLSIHQALCKENEVNSSLPKTALSNTKQESSPKSWELSTDQWQKRPSSLQPLAPCKPCFPPRRKSSRPPPTDWTPFHEEVQEVDSFGDTDPDSVPSNMREDIEDEVENAAMPLDEAIKEASDYKAIVEILTEDRDALDQRWQEVVEQLKECQQENSTLREQLDEQRCQEVVELLEECRQENAALREQLDQTRCQEVMELLEECRQENSALKEQLAECQGLCVICLCEQAGRIVLPCAHLVLCTSCGTGLKHCPVCRQGIENIVQVYKP